MKSKIEMREVRPSDVNEIVSFHNVVYGDKRTPEQWIWEYESNYPDAFVFTRMKDANRIIGTQGMIPIYINIKGKRYLSGKSENTLLGPEYRGRDLFQELYRFAISCCKAKGMYCIWGYTGAIPAIKMLKKVRFHIFEGVIHNSILILTFRAALFEILKSKRSMVRKIAKSFLVMFRYTLSFIHRITFRPPVEGYSIKQKLGSINDLDALYQRLRGKYPSMIHIEQDEEYIRWRILNNPFIKYRTYFVYQGSLLRAYCYLNTKDKRTAYLTDFTFESAEAGAFLLQSILDKLRNEKITYVSFWGNIKNPLMITVFDLLKRFGFSNRQGPAFVLRNIAYEDEKPLYDIRNWYLGGLWTEGTKI